MNMAPFMELQASCGIGYIEEACIREPCLLLNLFSLYPKRIVSRLLHEALQQ